MRLFMSEAHDSVVFGRTCVIECGGCLFHSKVLMRFKTHPSIYSTLVANHIWHSFGCVDYSYEFGYRDYVFNHFHFSTKFRTFVWLFWFGNEDIVRANRLVFD